MTKVFIFCAPIRDEPCSAISDHTSWTNSLILLQKNKGTSEIAPSPKIAAEFKLALVSA